MLSIDQYAYANKMRSIHPGEKFAFAVATMVICLVLPSLVTHLVVLLLMAGLLILRAGIPWQVYLKLMALPFSFLVVSVVTIALSISRNPAFGIYGITVGEMTLGVTAQSLLVASQLLLKSLSSVSCLYFLSLTTPMLEIISVLKKLRVPALFLELMSLIYRFIFVLLETANRMFTTQSSRCGYVTVKRAYFSLGQLISNLFIKSYHRSWLLFTALESRCYNGELKVLDPPYSVSKKNILYIVVIDLALIVLAICDGGALFG